MFIDAPRNINSVIDEEGDRTNEIAYMLATGMLASAMEHEIFEDFTDVPSVSAMKIFQAAGERHIPIYNITKANLSEVLPELDISQAIKNNIRSAVNSGKVVVVPQRNVQYFDWNGVGYIVLDPTTGAAGYMINGGLAGGSMTWSEALGEYLIYVAIGLALMPVFIAITTVFVMLSQSRAQLLLKLSAHYYWQTGHMILES